MSKCGRETIPRPFSKKTKLSMSPVSIDEISRLSKYLIVC